MSYFFRTFAPKIYCFMKKLSQLFVLISLICAPLFTSAAVYTVETVPSPKVQGQEFYVCNPDTVLALTTVQELNERLQELEKNTSVEMAIVAIYAYDEHKYAVARDFALELFNYWGIGNAQTNTGILVFLAKESREVEIITGSGIEGIMTDLVCGEILDEALPDLSQNDFDAGMLQIMKGVENRLMSTENRSELLLGWKPKDPENSAIAAGYVGFGFILLLIFGLVAYKKLNGVPGQSVKEIQDQSKSTQSCLGCLMVFFPIPLLFFYLYYVIARRRVKMVPPNCKKCNHTMVELPKEEENSRLSKNQLIEKNLQSCDYSLWKCPVCGEEEFIQHKGVKYNKYSNCPVCGAHTYQNVGGVVMANATYTSSGKRLDSYCCKACGHHEQVTIVIPQKVRPSSSYSSSSSSGHSSSHSSGSWGGGHSSGGGAGRRF
jgi:uncharacterized protein